MSVLSYLQTTSSNLVLSSDEKSSIETSISTLSSRLSSYFGTAVKDKIKFGSSTRGTILPRQADSKSDIDYMIVFDNTDNKKPQSFIERLKKFAESKYSSSEIHQSHPTVVLMLNHIMFDLVPAYKVVGYLSNTLYIPGPKSGFTDWITTDPNGFNTRLSQKNATSNQLIKPTIRLVKYWNACNDYVYYSFELEQKIVADSYFFCTNLKDYFYAAINHLSSFGLPQYKADKVQRAKEIVGRAKQYEDSNLPDSAEREIKKLIPVL